MTALEAINAYDAAARALARDSRNRRLRAAKDEALRVMLLLVKPLLKELD